MRLWLLLAVHLLLLAANGTMMVYALTLQDYPRAIFWEIAFAGLLLSAYRNVRRD